jgi:hypothetical protein
MPCLKLRPDDRLQEGITMIKTNQKTIYHFSTGSEAMSRVIDIISKDQKCREMVLLFAKIPNRKRRNTLLRMARHLTNAGTMPQAKAENIVDTETNYI